MICAVAMVLLCGYGWFSKVSNIIRVKDRWETSVAEAQEYEARGLHQKAIQSYEAALSIREDLGLRQELLEVCSFAYGEGTLSRNAYKSALESACSVYPKEEAYWVQLVELLRDANSYPDAYKALAQAGRAGAEGKTLAALNREITYSFTIGGQYFTRYCDAPGGYTTIYNGERWGVLAPNGEQECDCNYLYISPYSEEQSAVFCIGEDSRLLDKNGILQAVLTEDISEARAYGDGVLPLLRDGQWSYLNCEDETYTGAYEDASAYQNGLSAVCQGGTWKLVDLTGNKAVDQEFSEIPLYGNGAYCYDGLFSAAVNGAWNLYQTDGTAVWKDFSARELDVYLGSFVAYQDNSGLWGFLDQKGKIVIEPQYEQAKSFSGGLAAVFNGDQWGFINENGELAIDYQFLETGYFTAEGTCPVSTVDGGFYMITLRFPGGG